MRNIKLTIEYNGTNYAGWQIQKNTRLTIQGIVENALGKIIQERIKLIASGRTDAGVHAAGQVANFKTASKIAAKNIQKALNSLLPGDIRIVNSEDVPLQFHARFSAKGKTYRYLILNQDYPSALLRDYCYFLSYKLDLNKMRRAATEFLGRHDFSAFCASGSSVKDTIRTIKKISIKGINYPLSPISYHLISVDITADGFLYNMARSIVGTLLEVGRSKMEPGSISGILNSQKRGLVGPTAPASGLFLFKVDY
jgi:tRNA pseudouridine38-40 synthase